MRQLFVLITLTVILAACVKEHPNLDTVVYGHAGESIYKSRNKYPPNSMASINYALTELNADGVEVDVQMTKDHYLVLFHDLELDENSNSTGCINDKSWNEVSQIKVYNTDFKVRLLSEAIYSVTAKNKHIFLDVKQYSPCEDKLIDFSAFDSSLNAILGGYTNTQKELITVNCRNRELLFALTDSVIKKSFEYDDYPQALEVIQQNDLDMLTTKLEAITESDRQTFQSAGIPLGIFGIKTRNDVQKALGYAPDFVISDKIDYTLKALGR